MISGRTKPHSSKGTKKGIRKKNTSIDEQHSLILSRLKIINSNPTIKKILNDNFSYEMLENKIHSLSSQDRKSLNDVKSELNLKTDNQIIEYIFKTLNSFSLPEDRASLSTPLMNKLESLNTISYGHEIKQFKDKCSETRTPLYDIILDSLQSLWVNKYGKTEAYHVFEIAKDFENVLFKDPRYRDHFIHQFQVFLSGLPILDKHYASIKKAYSKKFSETSEIEIEFSWLLAATFHDNGYLVQKFDTWLNSFFTVFLEIEDLPVKIDMSTLLLTRNFQEYLDKLTSLYLCLNNDSSERWSYEGAHVIDQKIRKQLTSSLINNRNHGIISALILLDRIEKSVISREISDYKEKFFSSVVFPAGLAICLHDKEILISEDIKPIDFNKDPLSFILIYCDTIQEWGRPIGSSFIDYDNKGLRLTKYEVTKKRVSATITYDKIEVYTTKTGEKTNFDFKEEELKRVFNKLRSSNIIFEITLESSDKNHEKPGSTFRALR